MIMEWETARTYLPGLVDGAVSTVQLTALTLVLGLLMAVPMALVRNAGRFPLRAAAVAFVFVFRGTPLLALLYVIYYGAPDVAFLRESWAWALLREPYPCAVLALSLNSAGYLTEILSGAMRAVPRGEVEAAVAMGLSRFGVLRRVVAPNAARIALRSYGNEVIFVIKATSVASLVTVVELLGSAGKIYFNTFDPITPFVAAGLIYLALVAVILRCVTVAERRLTPELRARLAPRAGGPAAAAANPPAPLGLPASGPALQGGR